MPSDPPDAPVEDYFMLATVAALCAFAVATAVDMARSGTTVLDRPAIIIAARMT